MNSHALLAWLNFFIADVRDGLGPYLGVFLKGHNFLEGQIGLIGTIASLCGLTLGIPLGILVDKTRYKRTLIALCILIITLSTLANYFYPTFAFTLIAQISIALCAVFLAPAFAAITLGIVGQSAYPKQTSRNEAYKHAGTAFSAALSLVCALHWGIASIFVITALMGVCSLICLTLLRNATIHHDVARGALSTDSPIKPPYKSHSIPHSPPTTPLKPTIESSRDSNLDSKTHAIDSTTESMAHAKAKPLPRSKIESNPSAHSLPPATTLLKAIFRNKQVILLSLALFCFHLSNAAMLPLLSQRAHTLGVDSSGAYAAATIIIAQSTMIVVALLCGRLLSPASSKVPFMQDKRTTHAAQANNADSKRHQDTKDTLPATPHTMSNNVLNNMSSMPHTMPNGTHCPHTQSDGNATPLSAHRLRAGVKSVAGVMRLAHLRTPHIALVLMAIALCELLFRGLVAAHFESLGGMVITQILDGIGAGIVGVIVPILVALILRGSGHINAGLAFVMTCGGIGGALSGSLGGFMAQYFGYFYAYMSLGAVAFIGLIVWISFLRVFRGIQEA